MSIQFIRPYMTCAYDVPRSYGTQSHEWAARNWQMSKLVEEGLAEDDPPGSLHYERLTGSVMLAKMPIVAPVAVSDAVFQTMIEHLDGVTSTAWRLSPAPFLTNSPYPQIKYYNSRIDQWGGVQVKRTFDVNSGVCIPVAQSLPSCQSVTTDPQSPPITGEGAHWTTVPTASQLKPDVGIYFPDYLSPDGARYRTLLIIPSYPAETVSDADYLLRSAVVTNGEPGSYVTIAKSKSVTLSNPGLAANMALLTASILMFASSLIVTACIVDGLLIIRIFGATKDKVYNEITYDIDYLRPAGRPFTQMRGYFSFAVQGHQAAFFPMQMINRYESGQLRFKSTKLPKAPRRINFSGWTVSPWGFDAPDHEYTALTAAGSNDGTNITGLAANLYSSHPYYSPSLYRIDEMYAGDWNEATAPDPVSLTLKRAVIHRTEGENGCIKGSTCSVTLWGGQTIPQLNGNEIFTIRAGDYEEVDGSWVKSDYVVFTGRLTDPEQRLLDKLPYEDVTLELEDDAFRLSKKFCGDHIGSAEGVSFILSWRRALNAFGVPDARIAVNGYSLSEIDADSSLVQDKVLMEQRDATRDGKGELGLTPKPDTPATTWLDLLVKNRGEWVWRIEADGTFNALPWPRWDGKSESIALTLRRAPQTSKEVISNVIYKRNLSEFVNRVFIIGEHGNYDGVWEDTLSIADENDRYYIGDTFEQVTHEVDIDSPQLEARRVGEMAKSRFETLHFKAEHGSNIFPGDFVKSLLDGLDDIPTGTVLRIGEELRTIEFDGEDTTHTVDYTCYMDTLGDGTETAE